MTPEKFRRSAGERRALDTYIKLSRASETVAALLARQLAEQGLTTGQLGVLEALLHLGPMCERELSRKLLRSGGNVTAVLDNLQRRNLVRRVRGIEDRRFVTVELTGAGRRLIERVFPPHACAIAQALAALTVSEQLVLGRLCKKLGLSAAVQRARANGGANNKKE